jgi:hypothetical protein
MTIVRSEPKLEVELKCLRLKVVSEMIFELVNGVSWWLNGKFAV